MTNEAAEPSAPILTITGVLEKILFYSEETSYAVLLVTPDASCATLVKEALSEKNARNLVCVGLLVDPAIDQHLRFTGSWCTHKKYGLQFAFTQSEEVYPTSTEGIVQYLNSGVIKGMGPKLVQRIVDEFGEHTITILDTMPERLLDIQGLGKKTFAKIRESWVAHTAHRDIALFLQPFGVGVALTTRILRVLGGNAKEIICDNPYCLSQEIRGISFATADKIAVSLGFAKDNPLRLKAALLGILNQAVESGHVYLPVHDVALRLHQICSITREVFLDLLRDLAAEKSIVLDPLRPEARENTDEVAVYLARFYTYETVASTKIHQILAAPKSIVFADPFAAAEAVLGDFGVTLAPEQREAVRMAAESKMMVLTGGPGTGKTTIIRAILKLFTTRNATIFLAAPTGRAARRMQETTGFEAKTIHRLLEFGEAGAECARCAENPLACDVLIIDEASMIDTVLFYHLLGAIPLGCTVILVGDVNQLPSVGPGAVLHDIIASQVVPLVILTRIFRQSAESAIVRYAHQINLGVVPDFSHDTEKKTDFFFMEEADPEQAAQTITDLVQRRLPNYYHCPVKDIQVLSPMRPGPVGITALNHVLQEALNPNAPSIRRGQQVYKLNDKVMQIRNNYGKEVVNGDIGSIVEINTQEKKVTVLFDDLQVEYSFDEVGDELVVAYAISIHKSQGSEYPIVVVPLMLCHGWMLQRNLLYTAITRGKKVVVLVGERAALAQAVRNTTTIERNTGLRARLLQQEVL